jgi:hypothetical protein
MLYKQTGNKNYDKDKHDDNLNLEDLFSPSGYGFKKQINLQVAPTKGWQNIQIEYLFNEEHNNLTFTFKEKVFTLKTIAYDNLDNKIITDKANDDFTLYSAYTITYWSNDFAEYEEFIKISVNYFEKHFYKNSEDHDTINIYLSSQDGSYFKSLGKRAKRDMSSIYLPSTQKEHIINDLEKYLKSETKKKYNTLGINYKRIYLLEGLPGTCKTSLIIGLASKFNFNIAIVSFTPKMTDIDLLRALKTLHSDDFDEPKRKTLLVFEDIDCIFKERKSNDENRNNITFSGLLNALDGITTNNMLCFITTNYKHNLDSALLRPGHIDYIMRFDYAIKEQIINIYNSFTNPSNYLNDSTSNSNRDSNDMSKTFYSACCNLNINITTALLQQYLMKYIDLPQDAIDNIEEMKQMYNSAITSKEAEETGLYN